MQCHSSCLNNNFQKKKWKELEVRATDGKGFGLFAQEAIQGGSFVIEFLGEIINSEDYVSRLQDISGQRMYVLALKSKTYIDCRKKGSVAMWLVPVKGQEPIITMTCVKDGWKLNVRGYAFQSYQGQSGPAMFMTLEAGGLSKRSRLSWAPTGDTPIAQSDVRVTAPDLKAMAEASTLTFGVESERYTFNGFGKAGAAFPASCAKALGVS
ncbi:SET domain-containing protein [archaeon]|nr:MAG: SET domain-containing protein [archaeon]